MAAFSFPRSFSVLLLATGLLSGCCANNVCDCDDAEADAIRLVFAPTQFSAADVDTLIVQRYPATLTAANLRAAVPETVTLFRTAAQANDTLVINNNTPFTQTGTTKLDQYKYVVRYYNGSRRLRPRPVPALVIDEVKLAGEFDANGCCTCYVNSQKSVKFRKDSTVAVSATGTDLRATASVLTIAK